jgi:hypothetical protein
MVDDDVVKKERVTPEKVRNRNLNPKPENPLEISSSLIEVRSGRDQVGDDLRITYIVKRASGDTVSANDLLTIINPDIRLANLGYDKKDEVLELQYVRWAMNQMNTNVELGLQKSALKSQTLMLSITEPSLAKKGFLRKNLTTIRQESQHLQIEEQPKKQNIIQRFFGKKESA